MMFVWWLAWIAQATMPRTPPPREAADAFDDGTAWRPPPC